MFNNQINCLKFWLFFNLSGSNCKKCKEINLSNSSCLICQGSGKLKSYLKIVVIEDCLRDVWIKCAEETIPLRVLSNCQGHMVINETCKIVSQFENNSINFKYFKYNFRIFTFER